MPNMLDDGFLDQAQFVHQVALIPGNADYGIQNAVGTAIGNAAVSGLFTCTVNVSAYSATLIQLIIKRLIDMGYTSTLSGTTLTVNW
jgi:hypothetical protein